MNDINTCRTNTDRSNEASNFTCAGTQIYKIRPKPKNVQVNVQVKSYVQSVYCQFRLVLLISLTIMCACRSLFIHTNINEVFLQLYLNYSLGLNFLNSNLCNLTIKSTKKANYMSSIQHCVYLFLTYT